MAHIRYVYSGRVWGEPGLQFLGGGQRNYLIARASRN